MAEFINEKAVGERIKQLREENSLYTYQFADMIGAHPNSVRAWEKGHGFPTIFYIWVICTRFKVSADWLLGIKDKRK